jgi:hypothetical protein
MRSHGFVNSDETKFDSNCSVCDGKQRDAVHATGPVTREEHFRLLNEWQQSPEWRKDCRYDFGALVGKRREITKELYWYFLEILPPVRWTGIDASVESFYMSEALSGNVRSKYIREGDRYFHEYGTLAPRRSE